MRKRRKTKAEKMDAVEMDRRFAMWDEALDKLGDARDALSAAVTNRRAAAMADVRDFTPMRADFAWVKRKLAEVKKLADEIEAYR